MLLNTAVKTVKRLSHRGDQTVTTDQITTDIVACLMDARRDIISKTPKKWLHKKAATAISTVAGTRPAVYTLASDVQESIVFWYTVGTTEYKLKRIMSDKEWFEQVYNTSSANDKPIFYRPLGPTVAGLSQIELFPIPDAVYSINYEYYKTVTDMTTSDLNTEIPDIPVDNQNTIWKGGLYYFLKSFDDPAQLAAKADYDASLEDIEEDDEKDLDTSLSFRWGVEYKEPRGQSGMRIF